MAVVHEVNLEGLDTDYQDEVTVVVHNSEVLVADAWIGHNDCYRSSLMLLVDMVEGKMAHVALVKVDSAALLSVY